MNTNPERTPINETAYWMAACRASNVEMSGDIYAELWLNEASREHHAAYLEAVTDKENITLSLRHRFFLEIVRQFFRESPDAVFVNIGAGFTSYPFLLPEDHFYLEIDSSDNLKKKKQRIGELYDEKKLPRRNIHFLESDLANEDSLKNLEQDLKHLLNNKKSFYLLEGLVYYLPKSSTEKLIKIANTLQNSKGCQLGIVTWDEGIFETAVYKRFKQYLIARGEEIPKLACHNPNELLTKEMGWVKELFSYKDIALQFGYDPQDILNPEDDVFWETMTVAKR